VPAVDEPLCGKTAVAVLGGCACAESVTACPFAALWLRADIPNARPAGSKRQARSLRSRMWSRLLERDEITE
jgi:hypothetical protein